MSCAERFIARFFSCENSSYSPLLFLDYYGIMCHRWVAEVGTLETKNRKDTMMTESYENWESGIDWSRRTAVVGGPAFYDFVKAKALPALEDGLRQLEATKASCEERMRRWGGIAERADKLSASFVALTECEDFMTLIHDFDEKTAAIFAGERIWTLSDWLRIGKKLTDAMRDGSSVPTKYASELADVKRDMASASAVRNILRSFVSASDNDYRLRCAPERFRTRVFRDLAQDFGNIVKSAAMLKTERMPDFLHGIGEALRVIIEVAERMQGICRRAKKDMKRKGSAFWAKLDEWNAMRSAL